MEENKKKIVWNKAAIQQLNAAIAYIESNSPQNAEKVKSILLSYILRLETYSENFPPDKYKNNNDGNYRAFEKYKYRVSYYITKDQVRILRIRYTKRKPREY